MYPYVKRIFDLVSSCLLLIVISPIFLVLMLLVRYKLGSPIFFRQVRTGRDMKNFKILKFRTMTDEKDELGNMLSDDKRLTNFGKWLRSTSLDELPELFNIIRGEMSVIGPRPLPPEYNAYYTISELDRFRVRAGLITPDSIDPNPVIQWDKQFEYEADYGSNISLKKDLQIFIGVFRILLRRNESQYGSFNRTSLAAERKKS